MKSIFFQRLINSYEVNRRNKLLYTIDTWIPETVKYGISNFTRIGAFFSGVASSSVILGRLNSALIIYSCTIRAIVNYKIIQPINLKSCLNHIYNNKLDKFHAGKKKSSMFYILVVQYQLYSCLKLGKMTPTKWRSWKTSASLNRRSRNVHNLTAMANSLNHWAFKHRLLFPNLLMDKIQRLAVSHLPTRKRFYFPDKRVTLRHIWCWTHRCSHIRIGRIFGNRQLNLNICCSTAVKKHFCLIFLLNRNWQ